MRFVPMGLSRMQHSVFAGLHLRRTFRVRCSIIRLSNSDQFGCERRPKRLLLPGPILVGAFKERLHFMGDFLNLWAISSIKVVTQIGFLSPYLWRSGRSANIADNAD